MIIKITTLEMSSLPNLIRLANYIGVDLSINNNAINDKNTMVKLIAEKLDISQAIWPHPLFVRKW